MPSSMAAYNARFAKPPKSGFNTHPTRIWTWRRRRPELGKVTKSLTVQCARLMYLLEDTHENGS
jgi:hypothetical protein